MNFYMSDDLKDVHEQAKKNPNGKYILKWCDADDVDRVNGDCEKCPLCGAPVSLLRWMEPRKIRLSSTKYPDRLTTWLSEPMVISESVKKAYETNNLTGFKEFIPIEITKVAHLKSGVEFVPKYYCGEIAYTTSVRLDTANCIVKGTESGPERRCNLCNPLGKTKDVVYKIALDTSNWNKQDVFKVYGLGVVVSERFYNLVKDYGFTNFNLVPVEKYQFCV